MNEANAPHEELSTGEKIFDAAVGMAGARLTNYPDNIVGVGALLIGLGSQVVETYQSGGGLAEMVLNAVPIPFYDNGAQLVRGVETGDWRAVGEGGFGFANEVAAWFLLTRVSWGRTAVKGAPSAAVKAVGAESTVTALGAEELAAGASKTGFGGLAHAEQYGIQPYKQLTKALKGSGLQAHHLIEKRFADALGVDAQQMASVAVTKAEHQVFTNAWRKAFPYGSGTKAATPSAVRNEAARIYADYPALLSALGL
jgi:hypothetical protein